MLVYHFAAERFTTSLRYIGLHRSMMLFSDKGEEKRQCIMTNYNNEESPSQATVIMEPLQTACFSSGESTDITLQQHEENKEIAAAQTIASMPLDSANWSVESRTLQHKSQIQHIICSPSIPQLDDDGPQWSPAAVNLLISFYKQHKAEFDDPTVKKRTTWNVITSNMREMGFNFEASVVERKWRNLLGSYRRIIFHNDRPGNKRISWPYYKDFEDLYGWKQVGQTANGSSGFGIKVISTETALQNCTGISFAVESDGSEIELNGLGHKSNVPKRKKKVRQPTWFTAWAKRWEEQQTVLLRETCRMHKEKMEMMMKLIEAIKEKK